MAGWLRKAESKAKAQHSWGWNFAEYGKNGFFDRVKKDICKKAQTPKIPSAIKQVQGTDRCVNAGLED